MLSYIFSFFRRPSDDLSLEESCDILQDETLTSKDTPEHENAAKLLENATKNCLIENNFAIKSGTITGKKNDDTYIIDNILEFNAESKNYDIGTKVSYHKYVSEGKINIYNVNIDSDDWNLPHEKETMWSNRVLLRKVEKREQRILILSPNNIRVDLNKVSIEFIPLVGDWLELDIKCEVDENAIDLSGEIIGINKISPVRPHIENGTVTFWDHLEATGTINRKIFFNKDSLSSGYIPIVGDKIVSEVIESDQMNKCVWRALKVIPEFISKKTVAQVNSKIEENHPGLEISDITLTFDKLTETKTFLIELKNVTNSEVFRLLKVEFARNNSQCRLLDTFNITEITPQNNFTINCECTAKNMGKSSEFLILNFENFNIGKWVNIQVSSNKNLGNTLYQRKPNSYNHKNFQESENQVIRGQRKTNAPRFAVIQLPWYPVPQRLLSVVTKYTHCDTANLIEELRLIKPVLFSNLTHINYEDRFHTLLHLDEIANLIHIRTYDQDRACFIPNHEYLMLEIENLSERRPSIVLGDRIIATDPLGRSKEDYEGNVHKVGAKHVYLQFSSIFHETYNGEDYSIRVVPGRSMYRRLHHAIFSVARNLGRDILFPTKINEKEPQVKFIFEPYSNKVQISDNKVKKLMSPKEVYRRMVEHKENEARKKEMIMDESGDNNDADVKLDWYNKNLNCKQKDAVINILKGVARPLPYVIFGPPGTGKTVTIIETILQVVRLIPASRLLVTAPSNSAADLIALRLIDSGILKPGDLVRLVSVNYAIGDSIPAKLIPYCATASLSKEGTSDENITTEKGMTLDCSRSVMGRHKVTVSTCASAGYLFQMGFPKGHFTHIIVDEAGQAAEPEVMIPVALLDKYNGQVILAGDPMQLGPVVLCKIASECGLSESLLERFINRFPYVRDPEGFPNTEGYDPRLVTKLLYNYRSLSVILHLFSSLFYNQDLIPTISDTTSREASLRDSLGEILPKTTEHKSPSIVFHGVNGENFQTPDSPSWYNPHEAAQVFYYVNEFYRLGLTADSLGIITPYSKQVKEIRQLLREAEFDLPKVGTVEDFQGQEYDVIILSTVRSRQEYVTSDVEHSLGFVASPRRLNVAISRPKVLLVIVGNPNLLCRDIYWRNVIQYCVEKGGYCGCDLEFL